MADTQKTELDTTSVKAEIDVVVPPPITEEKNEKASNDTLRAFLGFLAKADPDAKIEIGFRSPQRGVITSKTMSGSDMTAFLNKTEAEESRQSQEPEEPEEPEQPEEPKQPQQPQEHKAPSESDEKRKAEAKPKDEPAPKRQTYDAFDNLYTLWSYQIPAAFFKLQGLPPPKWDAVEARKALSNGYIDYVCGRCIKANFNDERYVKKDPSMFEAYDRDAGEGKAKAVLGW